MIIGVVTIKLYAPWAHSLKEKRMVVNSIVAKVRNKFNISVAEIDAQDIHQTIVLGVACIAQTSRLADSILDSVVTFIEENTEATILEIERENR